MNKYQDKLTELEKRRDNLIHYLLMKVEDGDFHAVQDAGSNIREIDAKIEVYEELGHVEG